MNYYQATGDAVLDKLGCDATCGLDAAQVVASAELHGRNELTREKAEPLWLRVFHAATEPMILMLVAAGLIALGVNVLRAMTGGEADFLEVVGVFIAISLSVVITVVMEGKSAKAFEALSRINDNVTVKVLRDGKSQVISQAELVVGDIVELASGDRIPADGRLLTATDLRADESALTGESLPVLKDATFVATDPETPVADRVNMAYSGTYVTEGFGRMVVTSVGDATEFGKIAAELARAEHGSTPLQEKLARLGKLITVLGIIAASIVFVTEVFEFWRQGTIALETVLDAFVTSIVLIVAAVPEGLPTIVAVSLSINIIKLSRQNALVKKMIASETVGCVNVICSDKTGTLTENRMTVAYVWCANGADGKGTAATRVKPSELADRALLTNFCVNATADLAEDGSFLGNPTECALLTAASRAGVEYGLERDATAVERVWPFSSDEKHMTTLVREGTEALALVKGSPERVLEMCAVTPKLRAEAEAAIAEAQGHAYRVLGFAHKHVVDGSPEELSHDALETKMTFDGFVAISDPLRADVLDAIAECRRAGISLKMLTGDNIVTARAIASELGIIDERHVAVEAREIDALSDEELRERIGSIMVIARSTPTVKMRVVRLLKEMGNVVAVTGDGINDAPALKAADVGIAMGISGTEVSKEASDIVLLDDSFSTILKAIRWGRGVYENFKRFISFQLTVNVASVIVVFVSIVLGLPAPFNALELLWVNIIMDGPPALTLGLEPTYGDLMDRKPVRREENIISRAMLAKILMTAAYVSVVFLAQYTTNFLGVTAEQMPTVLFSLFTLFQLFNAFNCRELHDGSIFRHLTKNRLMLGVVGLTFVLQVLMVQYAGAFFGTVPLPVGLWVRLFAIAASVVVLSELIKLALRLARR